MSATTRINVIAEGQTEETFVRDVLRMPMANCGMYLTVRCVETGRKHGRIHRGGLTNYRKARRDIQRWLLEDHTAYVTTMFDLYGLPSDFPNYALAKSTRALYDKVKQLETELAEDIQDPRFIPYIQLHEFEGLLFSEVQAIDAVLKVYCGNLSQLSALQQIRSQVDTPEEIDDGQTTSPSKQLQSLYPGYDKVLHGSLMAQRIGLAIIRRECPHFDAWLSQLENVTPIA